MSLLKEIIVFAKAPNEEQDHLSFIGKISKVLPAYLLCFLAVIITAILLLIVSTIIGEDIGKQRESLKTFKSAFENFFLIVFLAPLIEELTYRLFLRRNIINISISLFFLIYYTISILNDTSFYNLEPSVLLPKMGMAAVPVLILLYFFNSFFIWLKRINYKYIFWFSCMCFALMHLINFQPLSFYEKIFFPILVIPQFAYGFIFGFMRVKYGFFWGFLIHVLINFTARFL